MPSKMSQPFYQTGPSPNTVRNAQGKVVSVPQGWDLLPPGDALLTRRVKAAGEHWTVVEQKGRRRFSKGVWAPAATIERARREIETERSTPAYQKRLESCRARREKTHTAYVADFQRAVLQFLDFHPSHQQIANELAQAVTRHATPVGSGTVARTQRIPLSRRAEAAVIAWMRHQTTGYDQMAIPRRRGLRREVRQQLARHSKLLLARYRAGQTIDSSCPLRQALLSPQPSNHP